MEITIHTGLAGDQNRIHVDWFDHNNNRQDTVIDVNVLVRDKPRTIEILVNGVCLAVVPPRM